MRSLIQHRFVYLPCSSFLGLKLFHSKMVSYHQRVRAVEETEYELNEER